MDIPDDVLKACDQSPKGPGMAVRDFRVNEDRFLKQTRNSVVGQNRL